MAVLAVRRIDRFGHRSESAVARPAKANPSPSACGGFHGAWPETLCRQLPTERASNMMQAQSLFSWFSHNPLSGALLVYVVAILLTGFYTYLEYETRL
jgi:hypothetical protein